jgi:hypothetical protein
MIATFNTRAAVGWTSVVFFPLTGGTTGTVQTLTVSGALASAGGIVRQPTRLAAGTLAASGLLTRTSRKTTFVGILASVGVVQRSVIATHLGGTLAPSGALFTQRQLTRVFTGTSPLAGILRVVPSRAVTGLLTPTGLLRRQATLVRTGTLTPTSTVHASPQIRQFIGTLGLAGTVTAIRSQLRVFTSTVPSAGALRWQLAITKTGSVIPTGVLRRTPSQRLAGALASAGTLIRGVLQRLTATLSSTGTIATAQGQAVSMAGTLASTGQLQRQPALAKLGSLGAIGVVRQQPTLGPQGALDPAGAMALGVATSLTGVLGLDGTEDHTGDHTLVVDGAVPMTGAALVARIRAFSGSTLVSSVMKLVVIPSKTIRDILPMAGVVTMSFAQSFAGGLTPISTLGWALTHRLAGLMAPVGRTYTTAQVRLAGAVAGAGTVTTLGVQILALAGGLPSAGVLVAPLIDRIFAGTLGPVGAVVLTSTILVHHGTIRLVHALLRFAGLTSPKLTGKAGPREPGLKGHGTLDDSELR